MQNFIISYDLNGPVPTHRQMDEHILALGPSFTVARVLETVWYVSGPADVAALRNYLAQILSTNDRLMVAEASRIAWHNVIVDDCSLKTTFDERAAA